ncbi:MAG: DUF1971 domain-containing protein [Herminiimonas sp.]|uniref:DUF1971 domain-containing protein n=1 Tax=Herminiimonas sp. TaxID=1926289 RepID=UPI0027209235|nr:DUF1971 domain-containing protein [Herminiimonas sp.]MDO9420310.1 DUF1971 domain-containing protein [Herminiimonas sp.]
MQNDVTTTNFYKATPIFDQSTLPEKLRKSHQTKIGTWGVIRVLEGSVCYVIDDTGDIQILTSVCSGLVLPEQRHHVETMGDMRMRVEFYDHIPSAREQNP